jgi:hypothetical protein
VQAAEAALPEFDGLRAQQVAAPEWRQWDFVFAVLVERRAELPFE